MDFQGLQTITVEDVGEWITNADLKSLAENFALEIRGNRITKQGMLFQGDFGTQHRFYKYPIRPNKALLITNATNTTPITITITGISLGITAGQLIYVNDVNGNTGANGVFVAGTVTEVGGTTTTVILTDSVGNGAYTSGGVCSVSPVTIVYGITLIDSSTGYEHEIIIGVDSNSNTRIFIDTSSDSSGNWLELTEQMNGTINDVSIGASDFTVIISSTMTENGNTLLLSDTVRFPDNYFIGWLMYNTTRSNGAIVDAYTASTRTISLGHTIIGSSGLGWADTDTIYLYRNSELLIAGFTGVGGFYNYSNGSTPQVRILTKGSKRKATVFCGNPSTKVFSKPMQLIRRTSSTVIFSNFYTLPSGWYLRNAQMPQVVTKQIGTIGSPKRYNSTATEDYIYDGISLGFTYTRSSYNAGSATFTRVLITLQFGEQESDPIAQLCSVADSGYFIEPSFKFSFDIAKIPKGLTGVNVYSWTKEWLVGGIIKGNSWTTEDDFSQYLLLGTVDLNTGWLSAGYSFAKVTLDSIASYWAQMTASIALSRTYLEGLGYGAGNGSILSRLGHVPDLNRSYLTPRFAITSKESRGAFNIVDEDDNTLRRSAYSGLATNMDDNYVDLTVDQQGDRQQWDLTSSGELYGLAGNDDTIIAFKRYQIEFIDPQSGITRTIPADVIAKNSIVETPYGVAWCGRQGIYFLQSGNYIPEIINELWSDRYDGTSFVTGTTQYITDANRSAAIGGYDQFYDELMFAIVTNVSATEAWKYVYRYSFKNKRWTVRTFELGTSMGYSSNIAIKYFSKRNDGTLSIGSANGIFKYPSTLYTDGSRTTQTGLTLGGNGFERYLKFNFGSIYNLLKANFFEIFVLDKAMSSTSGTATFNIKFFANFLSTAFETKTSIMDNVMLPRPLPPRGNVETLQVEISNTGSEAATKQFDITSFFAGLSSSTRIGNR